MKKAKAWNVRQVESEPSPNFVRALAWLITVQMSHLEELQTPPVCDCSWEKPRTEAMRVSIEKYSQALAAVIGEALDEMHVVGVAVEVQTSEAVDTPPAPGVH